MNRPNLVLIPPALPARLPVCPPAPSVRARPVPLHCHGSRACDKPCGRTGLINAIHPTSLLGYAGCPPVLFVRSEVQVDGPGGSHNILTGRLCQLSLISTPTATRVPLVTAQPEERTAEQTKHNSSLALVHSATSGRNDGGGEKSLLARSPQPVGWGEGGGGGGGGGVYRLGSYLPRRAARTNRRGTNGLPVCLPGRARPNSKPNKTKNLATVTAKLTTCSARLSMATA